jgi:UDP-3-O-[3-hydroxymyristoyl] glucosamine N-acyltransferase
MFQPLTHSALARMVNGQLRSGDPDGLVRGMNSLDEAVAGEVSFLGNARYAGKLGKTAATALLVAEDNAAPLEGKALIVVENPTLAFSAVVRHFAMPPPVLPSGVHPRAYVAETAVLGDGVHVGPNAVVEDGAVIGAGSVIHGGAYVGHGVRMGECCVIHPQTAIREYCVLGDRVIVHSCSAIGTDGFGYELSGGRHVKVEQVGVVHLEDDVEIGSCTSIDRARFGKTVIGAGTKIDNQVQIAHNVVTGKHCILVSQVGISGSTQLGDYVVMGGQSGAAGHLKIASKAMIMGRGGVTKDVTESGSYTGFPVRPLQEGRRLMAYPGMVPELRDRIKALEQRLAQLEAAADLDGEVPQS